jgi:multicomponent Na+:H+ antiporter subunit F
MNNFLLAAAVFVLAMVALGLVRVQRGPGYADRMMAAQLLGSGSIAVLLLVSTAIGVDAVVDVALTLALLAAFASLAFVHYAVTKQKQGSEPGGEHGNPQVSDQRDSRDERA